MSGSQIREDKTCLNCNYVVENRFCPNCGQENIEIRKTFYQLFVHFFEDLTHYENSFWKTIRNLLFKPASLTKEYLSGKRVSYLAPIRLYIFLHFITFFIIFFFQNNPQSDLIEIKDISAQNSASDQNKDKNPLHLEHNSIAQLNAQKNKMNAIEFWVYEKIIPINQKYSRSEIEEKFSESAKRNFPKVLFIYMPLFALVLWLFHSKKRWYYFDHGIFTLHYFSFLLLIILLLFLFNSIINVLPDNPLTTLVSFLVNFMGYCWMTYYFFPAHRRFYEETKTISFIKSVSIFLINAFLMITLLVFYIIYTFINIH